MGDIGEFESKWIQEETEEKYNKIRRKLYQVLKFLRTGRRMRAEFRRMAAAEDRATGMP